MGRNLYDRQHQPINGAIPTHRMGGAVHKLQQDPLQIRQNRPIRQFCRCLGVHIPTQP